MYTSGQFNYVIIKTVGNHYTNSDSQLNEARTNMINAALPRQFYYELRHQNTKTNNYS